MTFTPTVKAQLCEKQVELADYIPVAASSSAQVLGSASAAKGNLLKRILIIPGTTSPGAVSIVDGSGVSAVTTTIFTGGATSVADLKPFWIELGIVSQVGAWYLTTGANVTAVAVGIFT